MLGSLNHSFAVAIKNDLCIKYWAGFNGVRHRGHGLQAPNQQRASHKTLHILFLAYGSCLHETTQIASSGAAKIFRTNTLTRHLSSFMLMFSVFDASVYTDRTNTKLHLKNWKDVLEQVSIMYVWMMFCRLLCFKNVVTVFCYSYYLRINDIMRQIGLLLFSQSQRWITVCHVYFRNRPHSVFETPWIAWMLKTRQWCVKIILGSAPARLTRYTRPVWASARHLPGHSATNTTQQGRYRRTTTHWRHSLQRYRHAST